MEYFLKEKKIEFHCIHLVWLTLSKWPALEEWKMQPPTKPPKEETSVPKTFKV